MFNELIELIYSSWQGSSLSIGSAFEQMLLFLLADALQLFIKNVFLLVEFSLVVGSDLPLLNVAQARGDLQVLDVWADH